MVFKLCLSCKAKVSPKTMHSYWIALFCCKKCFRRYVAFENVKKLQNHVRCKLCQSCGSSFGRGGTKKSKSCGKSSVERNRSHETETNLEVAQVATRALKINYFLLFYRC